MSLQKLFKTLTNPTVMVTTILLVAVSLWVIRQIAPVRRFALGA